MTKTSQNPAQYIAERKGLTHKKYIQEIHDKAQ